MSRPTHPGYTEYPPTERHWVRNLKTGKEQQIVGHLRDSDGVLRHFTKVGGEPLDYYDTEPNSHRVEQLPDPKPSMKYPDGNPKTVFGIKKPPTWYISPYAMYQWGLAALHGALKYGHFNWRHDPVSVSTYLNAAQRHLDLYKEGEQCAKDSRVHHLAHVMACCAIVIDAEKFGTLIDDRNLKHMDLDKAFEEMAEVVEFLHEKWGTKQEGPIDVMANTDKEDKKNG